MCDLLTTLQFPLGHLRGSREKLLAAIQDPTDTAPLPTAVREVLRDLRAATYEIVGDHLVVTFPVTTQPHIGMLRQILGLRR